jgi:hypothetical protein
MRLFATALVCLLLLAPAAEAQHTPDWRYERAIEFPEAQVNRVRPYQLTVTDDGAVWAISSTATDTSAHNALWRAAPGATVFSLVQDFTAEQIATVHNVRGIASFANNVLVSSHVRPPSPFGAIHLYPNGDRAQMRTFNGEAGNAGYGTYIYALDATDDGMVYATVSFRPSIRLFDFRDPSAAGYGNWVPMDPFFNDEQAGHDGCSNSALRDLALVPGADYSASGAPFYTSRNQSQSPLPEGCTATITGRVSIWSGGSNSAPLAYANEPLFAPGGQMALSSFISTGITADIDGRVWVTGPDSTRRWVQAFDVIAPLALEAFSLPSATAEGGADRDPEGAPFEAPVDVALDRANAYAYVADRNARKVFVFADQMRTSADGGALPASRLTLERAFPNPFQSASTIAFSLGEASDVRLAVYDVLGREVAVLVDGALPAGPHTARLEAGALPSGVYVYRLDALGERATRTLVLAR